MCLTLIVNIPSWSENNEASLVISLINFTNISYEKIKEDPRYDAVIDSVHYDNQTDELRVVFHHDSPEPLPASVIGRLKDYSLDKNVSSAGENITLTIPDFNKKKFFRIKIGKESEAFEFGQPAQLDFKMDIKDSQNRHFNFKI